MDAESDAAVISASLDVPARFGALFDRHATVLFRYLVRRVGVDDAEPILGEIFRIAFEKRATYDCARPDARPWLYGIATNLLRRRWRAERRQLRAYARSGVDRWADHEEETASRVDAAGAQLAGALAAMRSRERDALLLYALAGLSYEEVALALEVPIGTVRTWLHRAREVARRELAAEPDALPLATSGADLHV
jgi:RNA polymerase sigma-70 factor (ECF subfamily)